MQPILASDAWNQDNRVVKAISMEDKHVDKIEHRKQCIRTGKDILGTEEELKIVKERVDTAEERPTDRDRARKLGAIVRSGKCKKGDSKQMRSLKQHIRMYIKKKGKAISENKIRWLCENTESPLYHLKIDYAVEYLGWEKTASDESNLQERLYWGGKIALDRWRNEHCAFYVFAPVALSMDMNRLTVGELKKCVRVIIQNFRRLPIDVSASSEEIEDIDLWKDLQILAELAKGGGTKTELVRMVDYYRILLFMKDPELCYEFDVDPMFCDIMFAAPRVLEFLLKYVPKNTTAEESNKKGNGFSKGEVAATKENTNTNTDMDADMDIDQTPLEQQENLSNVEIITTPEDQTLGRPTTLCLTVQCDDTEDLEPSQESKEPVNNQRIERKASKRSLPDDTDQDSVAKKKSRKREPSQSTENKTLEERKECKRLHPELYCSKKTCYLEKEDPRKRQCLKHRRAVVKK
jgi:hypothetical protein